MTLNRFLLSLQPPLRCPRALPALSAIPLALLAATHVMAAEETALRPVAVTGKRIISTATRLDEDPLRLPFSAAIVERRELDAAGAITLEDSLRSVPGL